MQGQSQHSDLGWLQNLRFQPLCVLLLISKPHAWHYSRTEELYARKSVLGFISELTLKLLKVDSLIYNFTKILKIDKCCRYWSHMHDFT